MVSTHLHWQTWLSSDVKGNFWEVLGWHVNRQDIVSHAQRTELMHWSTVTLVYNNTAQITIIQQLSTKYISRNKWPSSLFLWSTRTTEVRQEFSSSLCIQSLLLSTDIFTAPHQNVNYPSQCLPSPASVSLRVDHMALCNVQAAVSSSCRCTVLLISSLV